MPKRQNAHIKLDDALKEFIKENQLQTGMDRIDARIAWKKLMGNGVNKYTHQVELRGETLFVSLTSSVLREELSYGKETIIAMLNEELGKTLITKLVLR